MSPSNLLPSLCTLLLFLKLSSTHPTPGKSTFNSAAPKSTDTSTASSSSASFSSSSSPLSSPSSFPILLPPLNGPLTKTIFADPSVINVNGTYHAYATNNGVSHVPLASSPDFTTWTVSPHDALPTLGKWAAAGKDLSLWAPDVIQASPGSFVMYYTAVTATGAATKKRCIGTATATTPVGPFKAQQSAVICPGDAANVIDPCGFIAANGSHYLLHKLVTQTPNLTRVMLQRMDATGLTTAAEPATTMIVADAADDWNTEAPSLVEAGGWFYLFYSNGFWENRDYTVSVATARSISGPYTKASRPVISTGVGRDGRGGSGVPVAPGGGDVLFGSESVQDLGEGVFGLDMVFHAAESETELGRRFLWRGGLRVKEGVVSIA